MLAEHAVDYKEVTWVADSIVMVADSIVMVADFIVRVESRVPSMVRFVACLCSFWRAKTSTKTKELISYVTLSF